MSTRFVHAENRYLVPFDGSYSTTKAPTAPPKKERDDEENSERLNNAIAKLAKLQARLLASDSRSLLLVFQAMDAAGKDGTIRAVMTGINPAGCEVSNFKRPSELDLDHDFLWRVHARTPERGRIGIFNRSHYEEVLVVKVHPQILEAQRISHMPSLKKVWNERYESIRDFEKHLARNGTAILKFFLHVSKEEQKQRFLARIDDPEANWKFEVGDIAERRHFDDYMTAYEDALNETSRPSAPWYCVPADDKKYMRRIVAETIVETLENMDLHYPVASEDARLGMQAAKKELLAE